MTFPNSVGNLSSKSRQDIIINTIKPFDTRDEFIVADLDDILDGTVKIAGNHSYMRKRGSTLIPDKHGWIPNGIWSLDHFGVIGIGNETSKLQAAFNAATNRVLHGIENITVNYTFLIIPDNNITFISHGMKLRRISNNASAGFVINGNFKADYLYLSALGGTANRNLRGRGNDITIDHLHIEHDIETNQTAPAVGAMFVREDGEILSNVTIGKITTRNITSPIIFTKVDFLKLLSADILNYRTAVFLQDVRYASIKNGLSRGLGLAVNGGPGENSILIEASTPDASTQIIIEGWVSENSGEHGYRLGGQQRISDVTFRDCIARLPGQSILTGNLSSGEWHGGCGFKVLGGAIADGSRHKRITLDNCKVFDINQTYGSYPAGHGVNNYTPYLIVCADDVTLINCQIDAETMEYSSRNGILYASCDNLQIIGSSFRKCQLTCIVPYDESLFVGYPGYDTPITNILITGGFYEVTNPVAGIIFHMRENTTRSQRNWIIRGAVFSGGVAAVRVESVGVGGSYHGCNFDYTYTNTVAVEGVTAAPIQQGGATELIISNITAPWLPSPAYGATAANGSKFIATNTGLIRERISGNWSVRTA